MKATLSAALVVLAAAAAMPAAAQQVSPGALAAIAHFNQDYDSQDQRVATPGADVSGVAVSTRAGSGLGRVFARFNADHDGQDNVRGQNGATLVGGTPAVAQDIFARIRAESLEDE